MASNEDLRRFVSHHNILRRLAPGTEAFSVNVGKVDFVEKPVAAFVRLAEGTFLPGITEVREWRECREWREWQGLGRV